MTAEQARSTADPQEIANFSALAAEWWDPNGSFRPLHQLNPVRLEWVRDRICDHFDRDPMTLGALNGLEVLDVGCGGGLVSEPMSRMGSTVTGIDASETNIGIAEAHAEMSGAAVEYLCATPEMLVAERKKFDAITALEIIEHVADTEAFLAALRALLKPGGLVILSTLNRTPKSYLFAIVGAEYVLRWLPRGTHSWEKFIKPSELAAGLEGQGIEVSDMTGLIYNPVAGDWRTGKDFSVNYMMAGSAG